MARERAASVLNVYSDYTSFLGPKIPNEVKRMIPKLDKTDAAIIDKLLQGALLDIQGTPANTGFFLDMVDESTSEETITLLFSGLLTILKAAFRLPVGSLKKDTVQKELVELKFPQSITEKILKIVFHESNQQIENLMLQDRVKLPGLGQLRWRLDVGISTSVLSRVLEPTILMEITTTSGEIRTFEVSQSRFHDLRYNVAYVLKEMEDLERRSILKIQT